VDKSIDGVDHVARIVQHEDSFGSISLVVAIPMVRFGLSGF